jgi:hypothetical protein
VQRPQRGVSKELTSIVLVKQERTTNITIFITEYVGIFLRDGKVV